MKRHLTEENNIMGSTSCSTEQGQSIWRLGNKSVGLNVRFKGVGPVGKADCLALAHLTNSQNNTPAL